MNSKNFYSNSILFAIVILLTVLIIIHMHTIRNKKLNKVVILYYVDWCKYCKMLKPIWNEVKKTTQYNNQNIAYKEVNCDYSNTNVKKYPTIVKIDAKVKKIYNGNSDSPTLYKDLLNWITK